MPSLSRRREVDTRSERFESEIRTTELLSNGIESKRKFQCSKCGRLFEERSRICPRCETHTMGELRQIPSQHLSEARRNSLRRAQESRSKREWEPGR